MSTIRMDLDQAEQAVQVITGAHASLAESLQALTSAVQELEGRWEGNSRGKFVAAWEGWLRGYTQCLNLLEPFAAGIRREKEELAAADASSAYQ